MKDDIYSQQFDQVGDFIFDEKVAGVFEDMIRRSVPGYQAIVNMVGMVAQEYVQDGSYCYDLGCSIGACAASMGQSIAHSDVTIVAVDNSSAMVDKCRANLKSFDFPAKVQVDCADIADVEIANASMVVLNFTLQFFNAEKRQQLIERIFNGMNDGAVLVLSEKIAFDDDENTFQTQMHHAFKKKQGYSDLEISQKRNALENVLIPDTLEVHRSRLQAAGFKKVYVWFQCFNFVSLIAIS